MKDNTNGQTPPQLSHVAPLRALARKLHGDKTLEELVVKLRWRRKRPARVEEATQ